MKKTKWAEDETPQLHSATLNIIREILVLTVFSPCHPVEKDETNDSKMETCLHYVIHTSNPLQKQKSLSVHEIQATDRSKYCYLLTGDMYTSHLHKPTL